MILGLGMDLVEIERIRSSLERFGPAFAARLLHDSETEDMPDADAGRRRIESLAARFAAKEAGAKALGTGFALGIGPRDIRIVSLESGQPLISFHGPARQRFEALGARRAHLSLTHTVLTAGAVVIIES